MDGACEVFATISREPTAVASSLPTVCRSWPPREMEPGRHDESQLVVREWPGAKTGRPRFAAERHHSKSLGQSYAALAAERRPRSVALNQIEPPCGSPVVRLRRPPQADDRRTAGGQTLGSFSLGRPIAARAALAPPRLRCLCRSAAKRGQSSHAGMRVRTYRCDESVGSGVIEAREQ